MAKRKNESTATSSITGQAATVTANRIDLYAIGRRPRMSRRGFFNAALATTATAVATRKLAADGTPHVGAGGTSSGKIKDEYKPGDRAPVSGIYYVIHDKLDGEDHALSHEVTAIAGTEFPPCRLCGGEVRFRLHLAAERVDGNGHFKAVTGDNDGGR